MEHVDEDGYQKVPEYEQDDDQKEQDIKLEQMHKANIGDVVEEHEVEADEEEITDAKIDPDLKETYVPNIKRDDTKKEDEIIED